MNGILACYISGTGRVCPVMVGDCLDTAAQFLLRSQLWPADQGGVSVPVLTTRLGETGISLAFNEHLARSHTITDPQ